MNDVLPLFLAPMTRTLEDGQPLGSKVRVEKMPYLNGVGSFLLRTLRGLFIELTLTVLLA